MRIIFAKHEDSIKEYVFEVGEGMYISKGDLLQVDTMHGEMIAIATTGIIEGDGAKDVAMKQGGYLPLKKVITYVDQNMINHIKGKAKNEMIDHINKMHYSDAHSLPFD